MPLALRIHPTARAEIDPGLIERTEGLVEAGPGAHVILGRPRNFSQRGRLVVSAAADSTVDMAARCFFNGLTIRVNAKGAIHIAPDCTFNGAELVAFDGPSIRIGRDCMFSSEIRATTTDHHVIRDAATGEQINLPSDIVIGDHVWIGRGVQLLKGAAIGEGSVIGARSLVTGEIAPHSLALGVPAKVVRSGIVWER
ncbi:acyltransferase [Neoroseomonas oryzicola]|uniref:Acyltransferase n=1 Tax=Neoroseomonas oryzicola TaxID=535904 RepID=A0A9X9WKB6_9PROT|nr:acyltransferase [Neoroseomonas oryzicola]MBR0660776.1 acyltransferase [Neoroseomonas oryzicola]NKE19050.1 acyltransferase [Neoroseomonas oryzicola]